MEAGFRPRLIGSVVIKRRPFGQMLVVGLTRFDGQGWCEVGSRYLFVGGVG